MSLACDLTWIFVLLLLNYKGSYDDFLFIPQLQSHWLPFTIFPTFVHSSYSDVFMICLSWDLDYFREIYDVDLYMHVF